jgi:hypothetical protein
MDRGRYEAYVAARDAIANQGVDEFAAQVLEDAAEALLLARNTSEADAARATVPEALGLLVERDDLTPEAAERFWAHMKGCGPPMPWPSSWRPSPASSGTWVPRGH